MHQPSLLIADQPTRCSASPAIEKHCIFRSAGQQFSLPATAVRELTLTRSVVPVPAAYPPLAGLCHLRGRFFPVISLPDLLQLNQPDPPRSQQQLIVLDRVSPWAIGITAAVAVDALPSGLTCDERLADPLHAVTSAVAWYGGEPVQMLDPIRLLRFTQQVVDAGWNPPHRSGPTSQQTGGER